MPVWLKEKMFLKRLLQKELLALTDGGKASALPPLLFGEHHESHAASAFYPSPFTTAAVLCMDGVGEWATTSAWLGDGSELTPLWEIPFPHSIGLLYSAFTYYLGFKVNSGEYKVMGLAPYGRPLHVKAIFDHLLDLKPDGTFRLNMEYFDYCTGLTMTSGKFHALFGGPPREPETRLTQREMDLARSIQDVTEEVMLRLARTLHRETGTEHLCLAGGVALNCVGNGKVLREGPFRSLWIQPAAGDAGGAVGVALSAWHRLDGQPRAATGGARRHARRPAGPGVLERGDRALPRQAERPVRARARMTTSSGRSPTTWRRARSSAGSRAGWSSGPRALGGRSILGDARNARMQSVMNLKIKYRESFRPFAPSVLRERLSDYFEMDADSPYMLLVAPVLAGRRTPLTDDQRDLWGIELLNVPRSDIPAVTHVDYSARIQTVDATTSPRYHALIRAFEARTGCAAIVNTSFNVRGEPIVCTPADAYRCFMRTEIDVLVLENCVLQKADQKPLVGDGDWRARVRA